MIKLQWIVPGLAAAGVISVWVVNSLGGTNLNTP
jgi:hypothetical protein